MWKHKKNIAFCRPGPLPDPKSPSTLNMRWWEIKVCCLSYPVYFVIAASTAWVSQITALHIWAEMSGSWRCLKLGVQGKSECLTENKYHQWTGMCQLLNENMLAFIITLTSIAIHFIHSLFYRLTELVVYLASQILFCHSTPIQLFSSL